LAADFDGAFAAVEREVERLAVDRLVERVRAVLLRAVVLRGVLVRALDGLLGLEVVVLLVVFGSVAMRASLSGAID